MSHLNRPRAHFWGKLAVNVPTGNNATHDSRSRLYFDAAHATLELLGGSPRQFREWMHQLNPAGYVNGGWNYYGDHSLRFDSVQITSVELPNQTILTHPEEDACIGTQVYLRGSSYRGGRTGAILVDMDPNDGFTTQLFAEQLTFESDQTPLFTATAPIKTYSRNLNFWRNLEVGGDRGAAAVWYFTLPAAACDFAGIENSPFLQHVQQGEGISVRLCTYLFQHRLYRHVAREYQEGNRYPLPGIMVVLGTVGLWTPDEPITQPAARLLLPDLAQPLPIPDEINSTRRGKTFYAGATWASVDTVRQVVTLDLVNTLPEIDRFDTLESDDLPPEKIDLGTLTLAVASAEGVQSLGTLPVAAYRRDAYLLTGGIVEIPYPMAMEQAIQNGNLLLRQEHSAAVVLQENPYHVVIEPRSVYLELETAEKVMIPIRVLQRGQPVAADFQLTVTQTVNPNSQTRDAASDTDTEEAITASKLDDVVIFPTTLRTNAEGKALLSVQAQRAGMGKLWLHTPTDPTWEQAPDLLLPILRSSLGYFANVRVLPDDRAYDALANDDLNWEVLYTAVFRYYSMMYPIMNLYIDFDDEALTRAAAQRIAEFIQPHLKETTIYMPITRDLSAGKRRLLERWAAKVSLT